MSALGGREFFSMTEAARKKKVSRQAIYLAIKSGRLPAKKIGNAWVIWKADLANYKPDKRYRK